MIEAIKAETEAALAELEPVFGAAGLLGERVVRAIIARAIDQGIDLQRQALGLGVRQEDIVTPLRPPPTDPPPPDPGDEITKRTRLPRGVREE